MQAPSTPRVSYDALEIGQALVLAVQERGSSEIRFIYKGLRDGNIILEVSGTEDHGGPGIEYIVHTDELKMVPLSLPSVESTQVSVTLPNGDEDAWTIRSIKVVPKR